MTTSLHLVTSIVAVCVWQSVSKELKLPEYIPIDCGDSKCNVWTHYCHHPLKTCHPCNDDVCKLPLSPGGMAPECYFWCKKVKDIIMNNGMTSWEHTNITEASDKGYITLNSPELQLKTVLYVVIPFIAFCVGMATVIVIEKCCTKRRQVNQDGDVQATTDIFTPQGKHSASTSPQELHELLVTAK